MLGSSLSEPSSLSSRKEDFFRGGSAGTRAGLGGPVAGAGTVFVLGSSSSELSSLSSRKDDFLGGDETDFGGSGVETGVGSDMDSLSEELSSLSESSRKDFFFGGVGTGAGFWGSGFNTGAGT